MNAGGGTTRTTRMATTAVWLAACVAFATWATPIVDAQRRDRGVNQPGAAGIGAAWIPASTSQERRAIAAQRWRPRRPPAMAALRDRCEPSATQASTSLGQPATWAWTRASISREPPATCDDL